MLATESDLPSSGSTPISQKMVAVWQDAFQNQSSGQQSRQKRPAVRSGSARKWPAGWLRWRAISQDAGTLPTPPHAHFLETITVTEGK